MRAVSRCARALGSRPVRPLDGFSSVYERRTLPPPSRRESCIRRHYTADNERSRKPETDPAKRNYWTSDDGSYLGIKLVDLDITRTIPAALVRDACPQSRSPSSGNKSFATSEIPLDIKIKSMARTASGGLEVYWENDIPRFAAQKHLSTFSLDELLALEHSGQGKLMHTRRHRPFGSLMPLLWDAPALEHRGVRRITYDEWLAGGDAFYQGVAELELTGLVFIVDVPQTKQAVVDLGLKFGALQETFYGRTWDVKSKPQAENVAYTSEYLGLHADMLYLNSPPKLQFLHCLENDAKGGDSLFCDSRRIGSEMINFHHDQYIDLNKRPITFHYNANGFFYEQSRLPFEWDTDRKYPTFTNLWWSPPFQGRFARPNNYADRIAFQRWHAAAVQMQSLIDDPTHVYRHRLKAGECAVFDNHRVLHGRESFDPSTGPRHLHGTYVHSDEWKSTTRRIPLQILENLRTLPTPGPRTSKELRESLMWKYPGAPSWADVKRMKAQIRADKYGYEDGEGQRPGDRWGDEARDTRRR